MKSFFKTFLLIPAEAGIYGVVSMIHLYYWIPAWAAMTVRRLYGKGEGDHLRQSRLTLYGTG